MTNREDTIWEFLNKDVPFTNTKEWFDWQEECNRLGPGSSPIFIEALRVGMANTHYPALLGLRMFGYEAWGEGDGDKRTYKIRLQGATEWERINPIHKPIVPNWDDIGGEGWINLKGGDGS